MRPAAEPFGAMVGGRRRGSTRPGQAQVPYLSLREAALLARGSLDHLVGAGEEGGRDREAESPRGLQVDDLFKPGWLLYREITRLCTLCDTVNVIGSALEQHVDVGAVRYEPASLCVTT